MLPKQIAVQKAGNKATAFLVAQHTDGKFIWLFVPGPFKTKHDHGYDGANITVKKTESDCPNFTTYERGNMTFHELLWGKQSNGNYYLSKQQYKGTVIPHDKFYYLGELIEAYKTLCNAVRLFQNGVSKESGTPSVIPRHEEYAEDLCGNLIPAVLDKIYEILTTPTIANTKDYVNHIINTLPTEDVERIVEIIKKNLNPKKNKRR